MKRVMILATLVLLMLVTACTRRDVGTIYIDEFPPAPTGVVSITADEAVYLYWHPVEVEDIAGYLVYRNDSPTGTFDLRADISHPDTDWVDENVFNGNTYYYRLSAYDESDNESDLSDAYAMDTPRPEGFDEVVFDFIFTPGFAGFDIASGVVVPWNSNDCDFYLEYDNILDAFFINLAFPNDDFIQDFGYAEDFDDVGYAPPGGWSDFASIEAIDGHMYVLKLLHFGDWHYARIWVTGLFDSPMTQKRMIFSWAYQVDPDNRELNIRPHMLGNKRESVRSE